MSAPKQIICLLLFMIILASASLAVVLTFYQKDNIAAPPVLDETRQRNVKWLFGDPEKFEKMFRTGEISFDIMPPHGGTVLHYAAYTGDLARVKQLLKHNPDVYIRMDALFLENNNSVSMSFLQCAVASGNLELVKWLLTDVDLTAELAKTGQRLRINECDAYNRSLACYSGSVEVAQWLNNQCRYNDMSTKLCLAVVFGDMELFKSLYSTIDPDEYYHRDVWEQILRNGNVELAQWLLEYSLLLEKSGFAYNHTKIGLLEYLKTNKKLMICAASSGNLDMVRWLEKQGGVFDPKDSKSDEILSAAVSSGSLDLVKWLVERGFDINVQSEYYREPIIHLAAESGNLDLVKWLSEQGADVNARNRLGNPVIFPAAESGNLKLIKWLIEQGQDINARRCDNNFTVLDVFAKNRNLEAIKWAITQGADLNKSPYILTPAVSSGNLELVKWLFAQNAGSVSDELLHDAALRGSFEMVKWLSEQGLDVHACDGNNDTLLHKAVRSRNLPLVKWLVEQGLDIHASNNELYSVFNCTPPNTQVYDWLKGEFAKQAPVDNNCNEKP